VDASANENPADFLARERAALGDDADLFATLNDHAPPSAMLEDANDDLLGVGDDTQTHVTSADVSGFESSFPAIETQNQVSSFGILLSG
jgi:Clathrin light chain